MNGVELRPCFHMAGFLGSQVPNFDITELYGAKDQQNLLVNNQDFGAALALKFSTAESGDRAHNVVLMANHGFTTLGSSIEQAVFRAIYTHVNAGIQTNAMALNRAQEAICLGSAGEMRFLSPDQVSGSSVWGESAIGRPWELWIREVEICPLYRHEFDESDQSGPETIDEMPSMEAQ